MDEEFIINTIKSVIENTIIEKSINQNKMTLKLAKALIDKVEEKAASKNMRVVIAVSDNAARPVAIHCMDGAYIGSYDIALNKAFTAVAFQMSTSELKNLSQPGAPLYGIQHTNEGKVVIIGGGELLKIGNEILGAIGVSGGSALDDTELAGYGKEVFQEVIACL